LALEDIDKNIELIYEDDMCLGNEATKAVEKLIQINKVDYILGPLCNVASLATENQFVNNEVISLTLGMPNNQIANMGRYHFSFLPEIEIMMKELANYIYKNTENRKLAILYLNDNYGYENYKHFSKYFAELGGEITITETFEKSDTVTRTQLTKIKNKDSDAVLLAAYGPHLINAIKEMRELNINLSIFGIQAFETPVILTEIPELAEGIVYPTPTDKKIPESAKDYARRYALTYGTSADVYSANAFDSLKILVSAITKCGNQNNNCIIEELNKVKDYNGANGILSVDERGVGQYKGVLLKTVRDGEFVPLKN
jgi:branched-chain amino acid transport system substrate-binding protein